MGLWPCGKTHVLFRRVATLGYGSLIVRRVLQTDSLLMDSYVPASPAIMGGLCICGGSYAGNSL